MPLWSPTYHLGKSGVDLSGDGFVALVSGAIEKHFDPLLRVQVHPVFIGSICDHVVCEVVGKKWFSIFLFGSDLEKVREGLLLDPPLPLPLLVGLSFQVF